MEDSRIACEGIKGKKNEKGERMWSTKEEETLISALKDLVNKGWKSENGFRNGTDIRGMPHINSKIHVWKKNYGSLFSILSISGIDWNDTDKMIDAPDDDWTALVKSDPNARTMRYKSWPFYDDWCEIFGKDRATGHNAEGFVDAVQDVLNQTQTSNENDIDIGLNDIPCSEIEDDMNPRSTRKLTGESSNKKTSKKRKITDDSDNLNEVMGQFSEKTDARLGKITKCLMNAFDNTEATNDVFQVLDCFEWLTMKAKVFAAKQLVNNPQELKLFFKLPDDAKTIFIKMMLP
ncbi:uncharacterized protein At2g29880-like [Henckelia pumila]|uniref:uncharacterized protein At2g29880-like n=1 Tax=Henckelia pumila TaxID=405737 RepID=UPI003C6DE4ED